MSINDLTVVVCCNKKDFFLARICIASIRYYYPDIAIELIKDMGNGYFNTREAEEAFNVKNINLGIEKMGWSGAKFHYLYAMPKGKKVLMLDADIVFIGRFIERLLPDVEQYDYVVSNEHAEDPYASWVKEIYFDTKKIEANFPAYKYPGFFFNAGQMFVTTGSIDTNVLNDYFDVENYPYWKNSSLFPLVDQSVYNYLLPTLAAQNKLKLGSADFMLWGMSKESLKISLNEVKNKTLESGLIHWAGCFRNPYVSKMLRGDILVFFEKFYYKNIRFGYIKMNKKRLEYLLDFTLKSIYKSTFKKGLQFFR